MNRRAAWLLVFAFLFLAGTAAIHAQTMFYWEAPEIFSSGAGTFPVSAFSDDLSVIAWQETTPNRDSNIAAAGMIRVALAVKKPGQSWERKGFVGGPYPYSGTEPSILSAVIDRRGRIIIAAAASTTQTEILISENQGESFSRHRVNMGSETSVAPRLYARADGGYLLFVTRGREQTLSIYFARSDNGIDWSSFELFVQDRNLQLNFLPVHGSIGAEDFVFFQSFVSSGDSVLPVICQFRRFRSHFSAFFQNQR